VFDPFAGRGTTGIVATSLGRTFVGIDLYKENAEKASRNIAAKADGSANLIMGLAPNR
jgi:DNA modification methylase